MGNLRLYFRFIRMHLRENLQYRGWPAQLLLTLFHTLTDPLEMLLMFVRFKSVGEWTSDRVMLMYGLTVCAFGLAELFSRGLDLLPFQIQNGSFDRVMLRPRSTLFQAMTLRFDLNRLSRALGGMLMIVLALIRMHVHVTCVDVLMLALALAGGYLVYTGIFMLVCAVSFFTIRSLGLSYIFTNGSYQVAKVAPDYLPQWLKCLFFYILPMLPFCYLPAAAVCGWGVPTWTGFLALPAGLAFFFVSWVAWCFGVKRYQSTGS